MISKKKIYDFEKTIEYPFKNKELLKQALTHPSSHNEKNKKDLTNEFERLEFLGDRVLGLIIANLLFNKYKNFSEGNLSRKFSYLVQKNFLYQISRELFLEKILQYDYKNNKKSISSILSDSVESLIGAIFIDGGYTASNKFIKKFWIKYLDIEISKTLDPKTALQELSQQIYKKLPEYKIIKKSGPPHSPEFTISLNVLDLNKIIAKGSSIREAEKNAANKALTIINEKQTTKN
tara:strand:- start:277 stop:981 length:705 start_codon:yes stop_codon:yes gene_type:complete